MVRTVNIIAEPPVEKRLADQTAAIEARYRDESSRGRWFIFAASQLLVGGSLLYGLNWVQQNPQQAQQAITDAADFINTTVVPTISSILR